MIHKSTTSILFPPLWVDSAFDGPTVFEAQRNPKVNMSRSMDEGRSIEHFLFRSLRRGSWALIHVSIWEFAMKFLTVISMQDLHTK